MDIKVVVESETPDTLILADETTKILRNINSNDYVGTKRAPIRDGKGVEAACVKTY